MNLFIVEVDLLQDFDAVSKHVLSGVTCLFIDGYDQCIAIDCRTYPARSVEEPEKDKSLRGSRDGFVETIVFNTALIRRRIRDPHLVMEMLEVGDISRTDVTLCYMTDRVDAELLANVRTRINNLSLDALKMNQQTLAEAMFKRMWWNPFPKSNIRRDRIQLGVSLGRKTDCTDRQSRRNGSATSILDMVEEANELLFSKYYWVYLKASRIDYDSDGIHDSFVLLFMQNPGWLREYLPC